MNLMNKWWFRLYTLNLFRQLAFLTTALIGFEMTVMQFLGPVKVFYVFAPLIPFGYFALRNYQGSFRSNMEFHKMSIPFKELRTAFLSDFFLSLVFAFLCSGAIILFSYFFDGIYSSKKISKLALFTPTLFAFYTFLLALFLFWNQLQSKDKKYRYYPVYTSKIRKFLNACFIMGLYVFASVFVAFLPVGHGNIPFLTMTGIMVGVVIYHWRAIFHQTPAHYKLRHMTKYHGLGWVTGVGIFFLFALVGRNDVLNSDFSPKQRMSAFSFSPSLAPEIDMETFSVIERHADYFERQELYEKVNFDLYSLGVDYWVKDDPHFNKIFQLTAYKKPPKAFLLGLYEYFETNGKDLQERPQYKTLQVYAYNLWPKGEKFPDQYASSKLFARDQLAEERKLIAKKRKERAEARRQYASEEDEE